MRSCDESDARCEMILRKEEMMDLTPQNKAAIDALSYEELLSEWRFAPVGHRMFQGETGVYWGQRMAEKRAEPNGEERHVAASKALSW